MMTLVGDKPLACAVRTKSGWIALPDLPGHVDYGSEGTEGVSEAAAVVVGDTFYLLGGESSGEPGTATNCVFSIQPHLHDNEALDWRWEPKMPAALCHHVAGAHNGIIVVAGPTRMTIMAFSRNSGAPQPGAFVCVMGDRHIFRIT